MPNLQWNVLMKTDSKALTKGEQFVVAEGRTVCVCYDSHSTERLPADISYRVTQKKRELLKNPTKIEEIHLKKILTETEPLQLAF